MLKSKLLCGTVLALTLAGIGCRYDMQDQPRYKVYKESNFFGDKRASRDFPEGTVARGLLKENKTLYTGKNPTAANGTAAAPAATTAVDARGQTVITSFPGAVTEFPVPVTKELIDRGQERYQVFCAMCHGITGNGDGMIVRRGFPQPPTYNDDRLRNAPVGHFFDVITNGYGRMSSYAAQVPVADRWAIVAYIRTLQVSQNPNGTPTANQSNQISNTNTGGTAGTTTATPRPPANTNTATEGGAER